MALKWCACGRCHLCTRLQNRHEETERRLEFDPQGWGQQFRFRVYHEAKLRGRFTEKGRLIRTPRQGR
jgi:hypothetical protein